MESCKALHEYAIFINTVRTYRKNMGFKEAIQKAVDQCIQDGILADFLKNNKAEVISMGLSFLYHRIICSNGHRHPTNAAGTPRDYESIVVPGRPCYSTL